MATAAVDFAGMDAGENPEIEQQQIETPEQEVEQPQTPNAGEQPQEKPVDGRRGQAAHREFARMVAEQMPEHAQIAKELADNSFRLQAYKQHFPSPQEAANAKLLIEGLGGLEGATQLQQRIATYDAQDAGLREGNPEVLDAMFQDFPEGAAALAPHYLERLAKVNPEAFSQAIAPHAIGLLERAGFGAHLANLLSETDPERQQTMLQQLNQWYQQQKQGVAEVKPAKNPAQDRLEQERQKLNEEREQIFQGQVRDRVNSIATPELNKVVDQYAKSYKLNDKQKARFSESLGQRVAREMEADQTYLQQVKIRNGNKQRTVESLADYISSEFIRRLKDAAFAEAQELYGAPRAAASTQTGVPRADAPKTAPNGGPLYVSQRPADSELDLSRPGADMLLIKGQAYTKSGRFITWRKN